MHRFLRYAPVPRGRVVVRKLAIELMGFYAGQSLSRTKWLKMPRQPLGWWRQEHDAEGRPAGRSNHTSVPLALIDVERMLDDRGTFDWKAFGLYEPSCAWLDPAVVISPAFHSFNGTEALTFQVPTALGTAFPLVPTIDREGIAFSSMQRAIVTRVARLRKAVVDGSGALSDEALTWFQDLRALMVECISLIDVTLHQLYFKAQYDPPSGWSFDAAKLGPRHGQRLHDKFRWVHAITGRTLNADAYDMAAFERIRKIRNHLQHFDPPCVSITVEDAVGWLNDVLAVGRIAWALRRATGSPVSVPLIEILLAAPVEFAPQDPARPRLHPQPAAVGYAGCCGPLP